MKNLIAVCASILMIFGSCNDPDEYKKVLGEWKCTKWIAVNGKDICNGNVHFDFNEDKTYRSRLGAEEDSGTYKVNGNKLSVIGENKMEIMVEITEHNDSAMQWLMNSGGNAEKLWLRKVD